MPHANLKLDEPVGDEAKTTTCYMCACRCGIRVHLNDGRIRFINGNPQHPVNKGVICAKGSAGIKQHYSPARLSKPLLRVGERGAGEFAKSSGRKHSHWRRNGSARSASAIRMNSRFSLAAINRKR